MMTALPVQSAGCSARRDLKFRPIASGEAFLASPALPPPECLVLDIQLGGMSGLDLLRQLRDLGNLVPIIFVTAHDEAEVKRRGGAIGLRRLPAQTRGQPRPPGSSGQGAASEQSDGFLATLQFLNELTHRLRNQ